MKETSSIPVPSVYYFGPQTAKSGGPGKVGEVPIVGLLICLKLRSPL